MIKPRRRAPAPKPSEDPLFDPWADADTIERMKKAVADGAGELERGEVHEFTRDAFRARMREARRRARSGR